MEHKQFDELKQLTERQLARIAEDVKTHNAELKTRVLELEQRGVVRGNTDVAGYHSPGSVFVSSEAYKAAMTKADVRNIDAVAVKSFNIGTKAAIISQGQTLSPAKHVGIKGAPVVVGAVRDLLPIVPTSQNAIQFAREVRGANTDWQAAPQYSSPNRENVAKKELKVEFELVTENVQTIAGWIPASRQVLADSGQLAGYVNSRLVGGVKQEEEAQLLNGSGTGGDLNGLVTQATAYVPETSTDTMLDVLLRAIGQVIAQGYRPTGAVLNPADANAILLLKDNEGRYMLRDLGELAAKLGVSLATSDQMGSGDFLVGAFDQGATLYDRESATVRVAEQHSDFFVKNMVAILGEERLALCVYDSAAFVTGSF